MFGLCSRAARAIQGRIFQPCGRTTEKLARLSVLYYVLPFEKRYKTYAGHMHRLNKNQNYLMNRSQFIRAAVSEDEYYLQGKVQGQDVYGYLRFPTWAACTK